MSYIIAHKTKKLTIITADGVLLYRMNIANLAYYVKEEKRVYALIEFDLSFVEGTEPSGVYASVKGDIPVSILKPPLVSDVSADSSAPTSLYKAVSTGEEDNNDNGHQSGTMPFMAIETLDIRLSPYVHHVCHDLESLLYASVWHGVGYRWTKAICPYALESARKKKHDILRGWRVGSWAEAADRKELFLIKRDEILDCMNHPELSDICWNLAALFLQRMEAVRARIKIRKVAANSATGLRHEAGTRRFLSFAHMQPTFPTFADIWGLEWVECQKSCCVANPM